MKFPAILPTLNRPSLRPSTDPKWRNPASAVLDIMHHVGRTPQRTIRELRGAYAHLDCMEPGEKQRNAEAVHEQVRRYAKQTRVALVQQTARQLTAWLMAGLLASIVAPFAADVVLGTRWAVDRLALAWLSVTTGFAVVAYAAIMFRFSWHNVRTIDPPRWVLAGRAAPAGAVLLVMPVLLIGPVVGSGRGIAAWIVVTLAAGVIAVVLAHHYTMRAIRLSMGAGIVEESDPDAVIVACILPILRSIDNGRDPWRSTEERGRLVELCERAISAAQRRLGRRIRIMDGALRDGFRAQCRELAEELRSCGALLAGPDRAAQEELQQRLSAVLVNISSGTWGEGTRDVAHARRGARRGAVPAAVVSVVGTAAGAALGLPSTFLAVTVAIGLVTLWGVLDPKFSTRVADVMRLLGRKSE